MQTLEQKYAALVYEKVKAYDQKYPDKDNKERKSYGAMAQKLPVLVRSAGLAQALAFVAAKSPNRDPYKQLLTDLADVIGSKGPDSLLEQSLNEDLQQYIFLTRKTLLALTWFKRFSQSVLEVELTEGDD